MKTLRYVVTIGRDAGTVLEPHKNRNGKYVASMTKFAKDYVYVDSVPELIKMMRDGYRVRMSTYGRGPSLIRPDSLEIIDHR